MSKLAPTIGSTSILNPIITFVSFTVLGIVLSIFLIDDSTTKALVIVAGILIGGTLAILEFRSFVRRVQETPTEVIINKSTPEYKRRLAKYVANIFDEDIPFDKIEKEDRKKKITKE